MNLTKNHYIILISTSILLLIGGIFYYTNIQSSINAATIPSPKFNTLTTISNPHTQSGTDTFSGTPTYTLSNGLVLFDTSIPETLYDYDTDDSITKFVSAKIPFNNKQYIPKDLLTIQSDYLITQGNSMKLRKIAFKKIEELAQEFYTIFNDKIVIVSAYRSYGYQVNLAKGCSPTLCSRAGYSEHQLGLTIDIFAATSAGSFLSKAEFKKYYEWLMQNAHRYGWHNSYQKGVAIDTYQPEPWHWRYVGRELATELHNNQQTFAELYNEQLSSGSNMLSGVNE